MRGRIPIGLDFEIDKLTRSIENLSTGDSFATGISPITSKDLLGINKSNGWLFNWKKEFYQKQKKIFKLTTITDPSVIQGLVSLEARQDHIFIHLIENAPFNKGKNKMFSGVAGNLIAFVCRLSFQKGYEGNVSFISKTRLIEHYIKTLGAFHFGGRLMIIETKAATSLINKYFHEGE